MYAANFHARDAAYVIKVTHLLYYTNHATSSIRCLSLKSAGSLYVEVLQPLPLRKLAVNPVGHLHALFQGLSCLLHLLS